MNFNFPFETIRTDRVKSASIDVEDNLVKVTVPKNLSDERIEELIKGRILWIKQKLTLQATAIISKPKEYVDGEAFAYLGRNYRLKCANGTEESVKLRSGYLNVTTKNGKSNSEHIKAAIEQWYRTKALSRLVDKTKRYSAILKVEPTSINLKDYKAMWGSCSPKGVVSYNWRIILAFWLVWYNCFYVFIWLFCKDCISYIYKQSESSINYFVLCYGIYPISNVCGSFTR